MDDYGDSYSGGVGVMHSGGSRYGAPERGFSRESDFDKNKSPFRPPNDEEVFVTRETEKQKRKEQKE